MIIIKKISLVILLGIFFTPLHSNDREIEEMRDQRFKKKDVSIGNNQKFFIGIRNSLNYYLSKENSSGFSSGIYSMYRLSNKFMLMSEVSYSVIKNNHEYKKESYNLEFITIEVPLLFVYRPYRPLAIYLGPNISYILSYALTPNILEGKENIHSLNFSPTPISAVAGVGTGLQIKKVKLYFDLRYYHTIYSPLDYTFINRDIIVRNFIPNSVRFCLGVNILKKKDYEI